MYGYLLKAIAGHRGGIDPDVVNRMPLNDGINLIHYSPNHEKKLATNYVGAGHLLKVVALP